jgi:NAD(P)-dependent dehydrogenase (short-subunit alcohol dehydrogenase family)
VNLNGKRVLVIGGSSGIGFAVARAVLAEKGEVVVASSSADRVGTALERLPGATGATFSVTDENAVAEFFAASGKFDHIAFTAADWGQVDHVDFAGTQLAEAQNLFSVRFWGAVSVVKHGARHVSPGGSVTLTNGMAAHRPQKGLAIAAAMSGAVEHLVAGLAVDLAPVRVNGICPGAIVTEAWDDVPAAFRKVQEQRLLGQPLPRAGDPAEVAEAYVYLMKGAYTTGQILRVDGGWSLAG